MERQATNGLSVFTLVFIILLILKLAGVLTCSWWIVTLPLWVIPAITFGILGLCLGIAILVGCVGLIVYLIGDLYERFCQ